MTSSYTYRKLWNHTETTQEKQTRFSEYFTDVRIHNEGIKRTALSEE